MWNLIGLIFDLAGVLALGYDVIRIQRLLRASAHANAQAYEQLESSFGGSASWLDDLEKSARRTTRYAWYNEAELSDNAREVASATADIACAAGGVGGYLMGLATALRTRSHEDVKVAGMSLRISVAGLMLIVLGFLFQAHGSAIQACGVSRTGACAWLLWL